MPMPIDFEINSRSGDFFAKETTGHGTYCDAERKTQESATRPASSFQSAMADSNNNSAPHADSPQTVGVRPAIDWPLELQRHSRWLRSVLVVRSREAGIVEELFQEVALTALRDGHAVKDEQKAAPWLYRVAVRQALMHRRRMGRERRRMSTLTEQSSALGHDERSTDPLAWLLADERNQLIRQAVDTIPGKDAEILLLKYSENWSYRQIAEHLGVSEQAVDSRLHRARHKLRSQLSQLQVIEVSS
jgi:RNA polymerase sigma factor (sigma-70 family)